jgi:hypothetical protein
MSGAEHNLTTGQGESFTLNLTISGPAVNFTGTTIKLKIVTIYDKRYTYLGTAVAANQLRIFVSDVETAKWVIGRHDYRVDVQSSGGEDERIMFGQLEVEA